MKIIAFQKKREGFHRFPPFSAAAWHWRTCYFLICPANTNKPKFVYKIHIDRRIISIYIPMVSAVKRDRYRSFLLCVYISRFFSRSISPLLGPSLRMLIEAKRGKEKKEQTKGRTHICALSHPRNLNNLPKANRSSMKEERQHEH